MRDRDIYTVYIENEAANEAKELAQKLGMSFSQFIEKALKIYIKKVRKEVEKHDRELNS